MNQNFSFWSPSAQLTPIPLPSNLPYPLYLFKLISTTLHWVPSFTGTWNLTSRSTTLSRFKTFLDLLGSLQLQQLFSSCSQKNKNSSWRQREICPYFIRKTISWHPKNSFRTLKNLNDPKKIFIFQRSTCCQNFALPVPQKSWITQTPNFWEGQCTLPKFLIVYSCVIHMNSTIHR